MNTRKFLAIVIDIIFFGIIIWPLPMIQNGTTIMNSIQRINYEQLIFLLIPILFTIQAFHKNGDSDINKAVPKITNTISYFILAIFIFLLFATIFLFAVKW